MSTYKISDETYRIAMNAGSVWPGLMNYGVMPHYFGSTAEIYRSDGGETLIELYTEGSGKKCAYCRIEHPYPAPLFCPQCGAPL